MLQGEQLRGHVDSFIRYRRMDERVRSVHHAHAFISTRRSTSPHRDAYLHQLGIFKKYIYTIYLVWLSSRQHQEVDRLL